MKLNGWETRYYNQQEHILLQTAKQLPSHAYLLRVNFIYIDSVYIITVGCVTHTKFGFQIQISCQPSNSNPVYNISVQKINPSINWLNNGLRKVQTQLAIGSKHSWLTTGLHFQYIPFFHNNLIQKTKIAYEQLLKNVQLTTIVSPAPSRRSISEDSNEDASALHFLIEKISQ